MLRLPFIFLVGTNIADYWTTKLLIVRNGFTEEANPFLYYYCVLFQSTTPIILVKLLFVAIFAFLLVYFRKQLAHRTKIIRNVLWGLSVGLAITTIMGVLMLNGIHL